MVLAGTTSQQSIQYGAPEQSGLFLGGWLAGGAAAHGGGAGQLQSVPRVAVASRHAAQQHRILRDVPQSIEYGCVRHARAAVVAADKAAPPQGINFNLLVHRIHYGINMQASNRTYIVVGFGGSHNDFSGTCSRR